MKFSILIPVYNVEKYLEQCVDSLVHQTYRGEYEIILVDDGSTDSSGKLCDGYCEKHPEKIKVIHKENEGAVSARDTGIENAQGEYCLFVDSDDFAELNLLERLNLCLQKNENTDMVIYSFSYFKNNKKIPRKQVLAKSETVYQGDGKVELYKALALTAKITGLVLKLVKTEILKKDTTNYRDFYKKNMGEDWFRSIPLITLSEKIVYINESLYNYRLDNTSISRNFETDKILNKNTIYVYEKLLKYLPQWGLDCEEYRQRIKARWFNEMLYTFSQYYENAENKKAVVDFDWSQMLPQNIDYNLNNPYINKSNFDLYSKIKEKKYLSIKLSFIKKSFYGKYKQLKRVVKNG